VTAPRLIVPILAAALGVFGGYALMHKVGPKVGGGTKDSAGISVDDSGGPPPERKASDPKSMLLPSELAKGLAVVRREGGGPGTKVTNFRLAPGRINTEIDADGKTLDLYIIPGGKLYSRDVSPIPPNRLVLQQALPVSKISTTGPAKMVRTLHRRSGISPDDVNYLVATVDPITHKGTWNLYLTNSSDYYRAAMNGAHPQRCC
jgi:hypothetical protein